MRREEITFNDVYHNFKRRLPNLSKHVEYWRPDGYLSVRVFLTDGAQLVYKYLDKRPVFVA